jgi:alpha,alpha-trehalase
MRESGFDPSFRFGPFDGSTHHYAPVCLNSLLYRYEQDLAWMATTLGNPGQATRWQSAAAARKTAMERYLWQPELGVYADYNFVRRRASSYPYVTSLYPLWAGVATPEQATRMVARLGLFERSGGLATSNVNSGVQWDEPYGWAPTNWLAVAGLDAYGFHEDALRIAGKFTATVDASFAEDGTIREKFDVVSGSSDVTVHTGYKSNEIGFGWTNGVYLKMRQMLEDAQSKP